MAQAEVLEVQPRQGRGSHEARRLRKSGQVPAVVYGHQQETQVVSVSAETLGRAVRRGARVLDIQQGGSMEKVLIRELQWDHLGMSIHHVDFYRVRADERIQIEVRIELRGTAPGVTAGGVLDQPMHTLPIECLALAVPDSIRVLIGELQLDQAIHVKDLVLPEGVKALADADAVVVHVTAPATEEEPGATPLDAGAAEPEVIGRQKAEEEGEEGE